MTESASRSGHARVLRPDWRMRLGAFATRSFFHSGAIAVIGWGLAGGLGRASDAEPTPEGISFFESKIRPVLVATCYQCHSAEAQAAGRLQAELLLETRDGMLKGGESGPALVPGDKAKSLLLDAIGHKGLEMPPEGKLPDGVIADFSAWFEMGAPDPRTGPVNAVLLGELALADGALPGREPRAEHHDQRFRPRPRARSFRSRRVGWPGIPGQRLDAQMYGRICFRQCVARAVTLGVRQTARSRHDFYPARQDVAR